MKKIVLTILCLFCLSLVWGCASSLKVKVSEDLFSRGTCGYDISKNGLVLQASFDNNTTITVAATTLEEVFPAGLPLFDKLRNEEKNLLWKKWDSFNPTFSWSQKHTVYMDYLFNIHRLELTNLQSISLFGPVAKAISQLNLLDVREAIKNQRIKEFLTAQAKQGRCFLLISVYQHPYPIGWGVAMPDDWAGNNGREGNQFFIEAVEKIIAILTLDSSYPPSANVSDAINLWVSQKI